MDASVVDAYRAHVEDLKPSLPEPAARLADLDLHDGLFVDWSSAPGGIRMRIFCGDLQSGYRAIALVYSGAEIVGPSIEEVRSRLDDPGTEILYDELDRREGKLEHRFLLSPAGELEVRFEHVAVDEEPADPRYRSERLGGRAEG